MENSANLYQAILTGNLAQAIETTRQEIEKQVSPQTIINEQMMKAMEEIGARFEAGKAFVPELLMAARAMKGSLDLLKPLMTGTSGCTMGTVVIGTVKGDLHDIGKNLVASMLEGCGFTVINLGVDISSDKFVSAVKEHHASIVCMSALLTTTMEYMEEVIRALTDAGVRKTVKVMIGGAPVNKSFAQQIGADGYSDNANAAVSLARTLLA